MKLCWNDAQVKETVSENFTGSQNCSTPEVSFQGGLMKIAIYFSEKLILFSFHLCNKE